MNEIKLNELLGTNVTVLKQGTLVTITGEEEERVGQQGIIENIMVEIDIENEYDIAYLVAFEDDCCDVIWAEDLEPTTIH